MREVNKEHDGKPVQVLEMAVHEFATVHETLKPQGSNKAFVGQCRVEGHGGHWGGEKDDWFGGAKSTQQMIDLVSSGWKKGADKLEKLRRELALEIPTTQSRKRRPQWADDGHSLDVDRALAGQWDVAYRTAKRVWTQGPQVIELFGIFGGSCAKSADELFWNGAASVVLCDVLEEAGYSVRLTANIYNDTRKNSWSTGHGLQNLRVVVKDAGDVITPDAVAALMCHAGTYRTMGFHCFLRSQWNLGIGLGSIGTFKNSREALEAIGELPDGAIALQEANDKDAAIDEISRVLGMLKAQSEGQAA